MEFFSKYGPEDLNNKVYTQKYDHGINVQEVFERLVPLWGMRETITSFGETFPEVKGSLDNIVKRINDYEDAVKEDLNSFSANPEMYASNIKVKTDTLVAGLKVDINDVYIKVFDKHRDLADGVELLVTLNTVNDVMMGRSKKSKQAYYNKIIAQKNNLQRDITDYPDASLEDIINRHHDVEGTISSYYEKISIIGNFSHTVSEDLITTSEEEARALAYKPSNEVITTITGIKGNMTALGDRILALRDRINATKTTWFDSPEFRNFKRILNEKADLIHNSEEWSRQCNSQALDNMLKDLYKAADDYYFAKLGQSHNSRRSERFDIAAEMRELASTAMEKVRTPNADFTSDKKQLDIKKIFDKRAYHLAKVHVGKGMEPKSEDVYDNGKTDFENAKESEQGFLLNGMSSAELKKLADKEPTDVLNSITDGVQKNRKAYEARTINQDEQENQPEQIIEDVPDDKFIEVDTMGLLYETAAQKMTEASYKHDPIIRGLLKDKQKLSEFKENVKNELKNLLETNEKKQDYLLNLVKKDESELYLNCKELMKNKVKLKNSVNTNKNIDSKKNEQPDKTKANNGGKTQNTNSSGKNVPQMNVPH